jgi:hypothetical protein
VIDVFEKFEDPFEGLLKCRVAIKAGDLQALDDALYICSINKLPLPGWLWRALSHQIWECIRGQKSRGRLGSYAAKRRHGIIHETRWATVRILRTKSIPRLTWDEVFHQAAKELRNTPARGSEEAIRRSYKQAMKERRGLPESKLNFLAGLSYDYWKKVGNLTRG